MKIKYDKEIYTVENFEENGELFTKINGNSVDFRFKKISDNFYQAYNSSNKLNVFIAEDKSNIYVGFDGKNFKFEKVQQDDTYHFTQEKNSNQDIIQSPMPGNIVKILVEEGQAIEDESPIIIVEAMKMETTLYSSIAGIVTKIYVKEKEQIDSDNPLVLIEKKQTLI
ncbi:MAG: acetyl-CoA carboxylase biotin carboxyl carrier protein subunit [Chloroherpetonaceae bacterium]